MCEKFLFLSTSTPVKLYRCYSSLVPISCRYGYSTHHYFCRRSFPGISQMRLAAINYRHCYKAKSDTEPYLARSISGKWGESRRTFMLIVSLVCRRGTRRTSGHCSGESRRHGSLSSPTWWEWSSDDRSRNSPPPQLNDMVWSIGGPAHYLRL